MLLGTAITAATGVLLDGYLGVLVALFIMYTGFSTANDTLKPLLARRRIKILSKKYSKPCWPMSRSWASMTSSYTITAQAGHGSLWLAEVPSDSDILEMHDLIDMAEHELHEKFNCEAVIHMDPIVHQRRGDKPHA